MKYLRPTPSGCKDIWIRKFEFVAKTHFLSEVKSKVKAWRHFKVDVVLKMYVTFYVSLDLCEGRQVEVGFGRWFFGG